MNQVEVQEIAESITLPDNATDIVMTVRVEPGGRLPNGEWSGIGGETLYGPAFLIGGRLQSEPVHLTTSAKDARRLYEYLTSPEGALWIRKQARRDAAARLDAAETEAEAVDRKNLKRLERQGMDLKEATGGGSSRPSRSSGTTSTSTGKLSVGRRRTSPPA